MAEVTVVHHTGRRGLEKVRSSPMSGEGEVRGVPVKVGVPDPGTWVVCLLRE